MSITTPKGFVASGLAAGIKASGALDLALVATEDGVAGVGNTRSTQDRVGRRRTQRNR